ncbi:MAG: hypothetical protein JKY60_17335 [Kordiimonadaceae bacterium]|nr:hypothetical protein [Kordiimonadaceae bacterium]
MNSINPDYNTRAEFTGVAQFLSYGASALFVNDLWSAGLHPGSNVPFWSMTFEMIYYLLFAAAMFLRGKKRIIVLVLTVLVAGPEILSVAAIWWLGWRCYHYVKNGISYGTLQAGTFIILGAVLLVASTDIRHFFAGWTLPGLRPRIVGDYSDAIGFLLLFVGLIGAQGAWKNAILKLEVPAKYLGSLCFSLYLFHQPLIHVFSSMAVAPPTSLMQHIFVLGGTFAVVMTFGRWCETTKTPIGKFLSAPKLGRARNPTK